MGLQAGCGVLPCVEKQAVQRADRSQQRGGGQHGRSQPGGARHGWDEDRRREEDADGEFLGQAADGVRRQWTRMDQQQPCTQQRRQQGVEVQRAWFEAVQQSGEHAGCDDNCA